MAETTERVLRTEFNTLMKGRFAYDIDDCRDLIDLFKTNGHAGDRKATGELLDRATRLLSIGNQYVEMFEFYGAVSVGQDAENDADYEDRLSALESHVNGHRSVLEELNGVKQTLETALRRPAGRRRSNPMSGA